jgi:hypothetical protein
VQEIGLAYLSLLQSIPNLCLCVFVGKLGVIVVNLAPKLIDVCLEFVFLVLGIGHELVLHEHSVLSLGSL